VKLLISGRARRRTGGFREWAWRALKIRCEAPA
jgi:hypothetical protein